MADANALTYLQLQDAVLEKRFPSSARAQAKQWLAVAYQDVWGASEWSFRRVSRATFYTSADGTSSGTATATPLMPSAFARATRLFDDLGDPLDEADQDTFEDYLTSTTWTDRPSCFTVVDRQIILGPTPAIVYAFKLSYRRRIAHKNAAGTVVAGFMSADDDYPLWDDHHRILVPRAQAIGLKEKNDPTWPPLQDEYQQLLQAMKPDYDQNIFPRQWPAYQP